jgi:hypothetical protein
VQVTGDTDLGAIQVEQGFLLTGHVTGPGGAAAGVDVDVIDAATGELIPTVDDNTDATGAYSVVAPAGTLAVEFDPPIAAGLRHGAISDIAVAGDRTLDAVLETAPVVAMITRTGRLAVAGQGYAFSVTARNTGAAQQQIEGRIVGRDPITGASATLLGPLAFTLPPGFGPGTAGFTYQVPAGFPPGLRNRPLELGVEVTDAASGAVIDSDVTRVSVR